MTFAELNSNKFIYSWKRRVVWYARQYSKPSYIDSIRKKIEYCLEINLKVLVVGSRSLTYLPKTDNLKLIHPSYLTNYNYTTDEHKILQTDLVLLLDLHDRPFDERIAVVKGLNKNYEFIHVVINTLEYNIERYFQNQQENYSPQIINDYID